MNPWQDSSTTHVFASQAAWQAVKAAAKWGPEWDHHVSIAELGTVPDEQGNALSGYHVNIRVREGYVLPDGVRAAQVFSETPMVEFYGEDAVDTL